MDRAQTRSEHDERRNCTIGRSPRVRVREKGAAGVACPVRETCGGDMVRHSVNVTYCYIAGGA